MIKWGCIRPGESTRPLGRGRPSCSGNKWASFYRSSLVAERNFPPKIHWLCSRKLWKWIHGNKHLCPCWRGRSRLMMPLLVLQKYKKGPHLSRIRRFKKWRPNSKEIKKNIKRKFRNYNKRSRIAKIITVLFARSAWKRGMPSIWQVWILASATSSAVRA